MYQVSANFYSQTSFSNASSTGCSSGEGGFSHLLSGDAQSTSLSVQMSSTSFLTGMSCSVQLPSAEDQAAGTGMQVFFSAFPVNQAGTAMAGWWQSEMEEMGCQQQISMERSDAGDLYYKFSHTTTVTLMQSVTTYFSGVSNGQDYQSVVDAVNLRLSQGLPELEDKTVSLDGQIVQLQHACETLRVALMQQSGQGYSDVAVKLDHLVYGGRLIYSSFSMYNASVYQEGSDAGMLSKIVASYQYSSVSFSSLHSAQTSVQWSSALASEQDTVDQSAPPQDTEASVAQAVYVQRSYNWLTPAVAGSGPISYSVVQQVLQTQYMQSAA